MPCIYVQAVKRASQELHTQNTLLGLEVIVLPQACFGRRLAPSEENLFLSKSFTLCNIAKILIIPMGYGTEWSTWNEWFGLFCWETRCFIYRWNENERWNCLSIARRQKMHTPSQHQKLWKLHQPNWVFTKWQHRFHITFKCTDICIHLINIFSQGGWGVGEHYYNFSLPSKSFCTKSVE